MESVASTLDFIRKQTAARRADYNERWKEDVDVKTDADTIDEGSTTCSSDDKGRSHFAMPLISAAQKVKDASRPSVKTDYPSSCIGDHKYEYAVSPTTSTSTSAAIPAADASYTKHQRCIIEYYTTGSVATATDFTIGSRERSVSSYVRATASDASVYSRASFSEYSLPSSAPTTRSTTERLHHAGSLLQGLSYAELDLPVNADAVDRLRSKLDRLRLVSESPSLVNGIAVPSIVDCIADDSTRSSDVEMAPFTASARQHLPHPPSSRPSSAMSAISSASRLSTRSTTTTKKRSRPTACVFDPSAMEGSRRAALKAAKRAKDEAVAKAKERRMRLFKARPLPSGGTVTSNLFAPTKASSNARASESGKANMNSIVSPLPSSLTTVSGAIRLGTSHSRASRASFSSLPASLSRFSSMKEPRNTRIKGSDAHSTCSLKSLSPLASSPAPRVKRRNTAKRRKILAEIDEIIRTETDVAIVPYDEEFANDNDDVSVASDGNDMSTLQHQIAILEAQLRQTRSYNERTLDEIEALDINNLEDIDGMTITFNEDDRGENYAGNETPRDDFLRFRSHRHYTNTPASRPLSAVKIISSTSNGIDSLYHRQEKWASSVEKKLDDARLKRADDIMRGFTGKPQIASTEDSWERAKAAHDAVVQRVSEEQERKVAHQGVLERNKAMAANPSQVKDDTKTIGVEKKEETNDEMSKSCTTPADRKRQADYAERLSRPRSIFAPPTSIPKEHGGANDETHTKVEPLVQQSPFLSSNNRKQTVKTSRQKPTVDDLFADVGASSSNGLEKLHASNVSNNNNNNKSFADMNDKEFSHIMRRLGIKSVPKTKGEKKDKKSCATALSLATLDDETAGKLPLEAYLGSSPNKSNGKRPPRSPPTVGGRFVSSEAQANLFKRITHQEREAVADKMRGPTTSKSAASAFSSNGRSSLNESSRAENVASSSSEHLVSCNENTILSEIEPPALTVPASSKVHGGIEQLCSFAEPYQRYEAGQVPFFDKSSSDERGRFRVRDASSFDPTSMRRIIGPDSDTDDGIMLLVGEKCDKDGYQRREYAITILFDRRIWNEEDAEYWWRTQRHRFVDD